MPQKYKWASISGTHIYVGAIEHSGWDRFIEDPVVEIKNGLLHIKGGEVVGTFVEFPSKEKIEDFVNAALVKRKKWWLFGEEIVEVKWGWAVLKKRKPFDATFSSFILEKDG